LYLLVTYNNIGEIIALKNNSYIERILVYDQKNNVYRNLSLPIDPSLLNIIIIVVVKTSFISIEIKIINYNNFKIIWCRFK